MYGFHRFLNERGCRLSASTTLFSSGDDPSGLVKIANVADSAAKQIFSFFMPSRQVISARLS
jgi:hypothetical protein